MTKEEIAVLGHAFFDGKTIQRNHGGGFEDWPEVHCPDFVRSAAEWRIKPDEPKTITICTLVYANGVVCLAIKGSEDFRDSINEGWIHIKSLDQVVEVE